MRIIDENGAIVENPDLTVGYLVADTEPVEHPAQKAVAEKWHWETITEYPNGGKDVQKIIDQPAVEGRDAWTEEMSIQRYVRYTTEELAAQLEESKKVKIAQSKTKLKEYFASHPLQWIDGEYYSVTEEKQSLLTSNLAAYQISVAINEPVELTWNTTGERCKVWTYENLAALSLAIVKYVKPLVSKQQDIEIKIKNCISIEEVESIKVDYEQ